jgi:hypothetical protein
MIRREDLDAQSFAEIGATSPLPPLTPGDVLLEAFMRPTGLSARVLAVELWMSPQTAHDLAMARAARIGVAA